MNKLIWFSNLNTILKALIAGLFTWGITVLGALTVFFFKKINKKVLDTVLGFSAGIMIAASFWSLIMPSLELSEKLGYIKWLFPALGFVIGGLFVLLYDKFLDKIILKKNKKIKNDSLKRSILLVSAITIHNIPEGLAIGVAFGSITNLGVPLIGAVMLALGIGIQNFPEGAAVSLPLRNEGISRNKSFILGALSALVEPISAVIGAILVTFVNSILPFLLSFAAGAMILVATGELLPESFEKNKNLSILGLIFGFIIMMILDVALG